MGAISSLGGFFNEEWERFVEGVKLLHPDAAEAELRKRKSLALVEGAPRTISIPGWDDFIKTGPRYQPTEAERTEYWTARSEKRAPQLSATLTRDLDRRRVQAENSRTSATPGWDVGWGKILTAIDNVQDFASTVSTFGRLLLWGAPVLGSPLVAVPDAAVAARKAFLDFLSSAAGKALAAGGRADLAQRLAEQAGRRAAAAIVSGRGVSLAARLGLRLIPGLGTAILITDMLNTVSLLGMMANTLYGFLCGGLREALAAGVPMAVFKRALQGEAWRWLRSNPFGRSARLRRRAKALGKLPGFTDLLEVGQTVESLTGYGLSFGWLAGGMVEAVNGLNLAAQGQSVSIDARPFLASFGATINRPLVERSPAELLLARQAGRVLQTAPLLLLHPEQLADDDVVLILTTYAVAFDTVSRQLRGHQWQDALGAAWDEPWSGSVDVEPFTMDAIVAAGLDISTGSRWPVAGGPATLTAVEAADLIGRPAGAALGRWLLARRHTELAPFVGALMSSIAELFIWTLEEDPDLAAWELTPDSRVIHSLAEEGLLLSLADPPEALWAFWRAARAILEARPHQTLVARQLRALAAVHGVQLMSSLPPDSPLPLEWQVALGQALTR